ERAAAQRGEADGGHRAHGRQYPEGARWVLVAPAYRYRRGGRRQQRDHHRAVAGRRGGQRVRAEEGEADDHAAGDDGQLRPPGARLPSTRALVARYSASPVTVQKALRVLAGQGLVESRPGVGTFARATRGERATDYGWQTGALGSPGGRLAPLSTALRTVPND